MMAVIAHHEDGNCCKLFACKRDFDLQTWANNKQQYLKFLRIVRLETIEL